MPGKLKPESVGRDDLRERPLFAVWNSLLFLFILAPLKGAAFLWMQVRGTVGSVVGFVRWLQFDYVIPPAIRDTVTWVLRIVPEALGLRDTGRYRQVTSAFVLLVVAFLSTVLTGGLAIAIYVVAALLVGIGLARFVPFINDGWEKARSKLPIKDDYDVPRWSRE